MTRARRGRPAANSLDLLLDTICNTFGGVLFLAMLVSLMLAQTRRSSQAESTASDPRPAISAAELTRLESQAALLSHRIDADRRTLGSLRSLADDLRDPAADRKLADMAAAEAERDKAESRHASLLSDVSATQGAVARAKSVGAARARDRDAVRQRAEWASRELTRVEKDRQELMASALRLSKEQKDTAAVNAGGRAPLERESTRREFGLMLRYGRLYCMKVPLGGGLVVNTDDFTVTVKDHPLGQKRNVAIAKPYAGIDLKGSGSRAQEIDRVLAKFPAERWYPCLVVFPDSFAEFLVLKTMLVERGYEYRPLPTDAEVSDRGGDGRPQ